MTTLDIKGICFAGGNVIVSASELSPIELKSIALTAKECKVGMIVKHAYKLSSLSCKGIALAGGPGTVTFDFTE